jgi:hypothetical protein
MDTCKIGCKFVDWISIDCHGIQQLEGVANVLTQDAEVSLTVIRSGCVRKGRNNDSQEMCVVPHYITTHTNSIT